MADFRLCIVLDCTGSMSAQLRALLPTLQELMQVFKLCGKSIPISVLAYLDYCDSWVTKYEDSPDQLESFIESLTANGGGDGPEAAKTAARDLLTHIRAANASTSTSLSNAPATRTLVLWYTDAPPHTDLALRDSYANNISAEKDRLGDDFDWCRLCVQLAEQHAHVFPILHTRCSALTNSFFAYMARATGGVALGLEDINSSAAYGSTSVTLLLSVLGHVAGTAPDAFPKAKMLRIRADAGEGPQQQQGSKGTKGAKGGKAGGEGKMEGADAGVAEVKAEWVTPEVEPLFEQRESLLDLFKKDEEYQATVFSVYSSLITPDHVTSLAYNPLFAAVWRQGLCGNRRDPRLQPLLDRFSAVVAELEGEDAETMQEFLASSYNRAAEVEALLASAPSPMPALALDAAVPLKSHKDILELFRSCSPTSLRFMSTFLSSLLPVHVPGPSHIPLSLPDDQLFSVLLHTVTPGMMISKRNAVVLAMVAVATCASVVLEPATRLLRLSVGTWLSDDVPENYSYGFVKLALRADAALGHVGGVLTAQERAVMQRLRVAGGIRANELTNLLVQLPYTSMKTVRPDVKSACGSCGQLRSFTLMLPDGTCGLCACDVQAAGGRPDASCWCECRTCKRHYAVEQPDLLRVLPKCHGCRTGTELPGVACGSCHNVFVYPAASEQQQREGFTCPVCAVEVPKPQEVEVQLKRWLGLEPQVGGYRVAKVEELFRGSLWDLSREAGREVFDAVGVPTAAADAGTAAGGPAGATAAAAAAEGGLPAAQVWERKPVLNLEEVRARVLGWVESDLSELGSCGLCFGEVPKQALLAVCGRSGCSAVGCRACLDTWYGGLKPGGNIVLAQLHCPFCKKRPAPRVQLRHNRAACGLRLGAEGLSADTHYAWCRVCNGAVAIAARECQVEAPVVAGWACGVCAEEEARRSGEADVAVVAAYKACPGCGVRTEKTYGCDHMSCTMCGKHWCYECAEFCAEGPDEVYEHMSGAHGGVGL